MCGQSGRTQSISLLSEQRASPFFLLVRKIVQENRTGIPLRSAVNVQTSTGASLCRLIPGLQSPNIQWSSPWHPFCKSIHSLFSKFQNWSHFQQHWTSWFTECTPRPWWGQVKCGVNAPVFIAGPIIFSYLLGLSMSGISIIPKMAKGGHSFFIGSHGTVELMEVPSW